MTTKRIERWKLVNPQRVEIRRCAAFEPGELHGHEKFPALARRGLPGGILEVAIVDQGHGHWRFSLADTSWVDIEKCEGGLLGCP